MVSDSNFLGAGIEVGRVLRSVRFKYTVTTTAIRRIFPNTQDQTRKFCCVEGREISASVSSDFECVV